MFHNLQYFLPKTIRIRQMISIKKIILNTHSLIIFGNQTTFTIEKNDPLIVNQKNICNRQKEQHVSTNFITILFKS